MLDNPYSEGFDGAFVMLRKQAVEQTLTEICVTYADMIHSTAERLEKQPHELTTAMIARILVGRPAVDPGGKHDLHVTKPIHPCNTQSSLDDLKVMEHVETVADTKGHVWGKTVYHKHADGAAFNLQISEKVRPDAA